MQQLVRTPSGQIAIQSPKTAKGKRTIPLSNAMLETLRTHRLKRTEDRLTSDSYSNLDLVFARPNGKPLNPRNLTTDFALRLKKAEVSKIRFHDLRHTFATLALQAGVQLKTVQETWGMRTYPRPGTHTNMWSGASKRRPSF